MLRLVPVDVVVVERAVHFEHVVAFALRGFEGHEFGDGVVDVEEDERLVLVGLVGLDQLLVFGGREVFAVGILPQHERLRLFSEFLIGEDSVLDEDFQVVPLLLEFGAHGVEQLLQAVGHLARDVVRDLLDVRIALEIAARDVERDVGRIDHAVQQREVLRYDSFDLIRHVDLVGVELDLVLLNLEVVADLREVENARQVERIVDVQVDREERLFARRVELVVELLVLLFGDVGRLAHPQRIGVVDDVVLVGIDILAVLPLLDLAEGDGNGQEPAVFAQQFLDFGRFGVLLGLFGEVQDDRRPAVVRLVALLHRELGRAVALPVHGFAALLVGSGDDLHLVRDHERRVEPQTEVADDRLILVLGHELLGAREGDLVDVAVDLVGRHADSAVGDREQPLVGVHRNADRQVAQFTLHFAARSQCFEFLRGVDCVRHQFAQEDFVVGIEEFLDDGKDVFGRHPDFTVCHSRILVLVCFFRSRRDQTMCQRTFPARMTAGD